jgi:hypothetical protein
MNNISKTEKNILLYVDHHSFLESQRKKMVDVVYVEGHKEIPEGRGTSNGPSDGGELEENEWLSDDSDGTYFQFADSRLWHRYG